MAQRNLQGLQSVFFVRHRLGGTKDSAPPDAVPGFDQASAGTGRVERGSTEARTLSEYRLRMRSA